MGFKKHPKTISREHPGVAKASPGFEVGKTAKNCIAWGKAAIKAWCGQPCEAAEGGCSPPACLSY